MQIPFHKFFDIGICLTCMKNIPFKSLVIFSDRRSFLWLWQVFYHGTRTVVT